MGLGGAATWVRVDFWENFNPVIASDLGEAFYPDTRYRGLSHALPGGGEIFYQNTPKKTTTDWGQNFENSGVNRPASDIKKS
jgi:hypothetical protein